MINDTEFAILSQEKKFKEALSDAESALWEAARLAPNKDIRRRLIQMVTINIANIESELVAMYTA